MDMLPRAANLLAARKTKNQTNTETNMRTSILDQFAADAINAPETVTGGRRGRGRCDGGTRTRTRTRGNAANAMIAANRRGRTRTLTRPTARSGDAFCIAGKKRRAREGSPVFYNRYLDLALLPLASPSAQS